MHVYFLCFKLTAVKRQRGLGWSEGSAQTVKFMDNARQDITCVSLHWWVTPYTWKVERGKGRHKGERQRVRKEKRKVDDGTQRSDRGWHKTDGKGENNWRQTYETKKGIRRNIRCLFFWDQIVRNQLRIGLRHSSWLWQSEDFNPI